MDTRIEDVLKFDLTIRRELLRKAVSYRSGEGLLNTVYMGGIATCALCRVLGIEYGSGGLVSAIEQADSATIDEALKGPACHTTLYMLEHPRKRCSECGQIVPA